MTPLILMLALPNSAPAIIDFFREFTVHVDTLGHVCSFAVFDFKRHGNIRFGAPSFGEQDINTQEAGKDGRWQEDERLQSKDGKMEKSFLAFKAAHPEWTPSDPVGSLYLERLREMHQDMSTSRYHGGGLTRQSTAPAIGSASIQGRSTLAERSQLYEKALAQSMAKARSRKGMVGSLQMTPATSGPSKDRTVPSEEHNAFVSHSQHVHDDRAEDGGIGSELGDSYVDDVRTRGGRVFLTETAQMAEEDSKAREEEELEAEELANGGVLGLLAQIYDLHEINKSHSLAIPTKLSLGTHHRAALVMPPKNKTQDSAQKLGNFFTNLESGSANFNQEGGPQPKFAQPISQEALEKLAERLKELVGEDFDMPNEQ
ncbi:16212_t:CDS:2, partial [Acaulospora colombiana]